jgi:hypothetical protein
MEISRFRQIIAAYGADPKRWPEAERTAALVLFDDSPEAQAMCRVAGDLDAVLAASPLPQSSPELIAAVLTDAGAAQWWQRLQALWPFGPLWQPAVSLAAAAILGIVVGAYTGGETGGLVAEIDSLILG